MIHRVAHSLARYLPQAKLFHQELVCEGGLAFYKQTVLKLEYNPLLIIVEHISHDVYTHLMMCIYFVLKSVFYFCSSLLPAAEMIPI